LKLKKARQFSGVLSEWEVSVNDPSRSKLESIAFRNT